MYGTINTDLRINYLFNILIQFINLICFCRAVFQFFQKPLLGHHRDLNLFVTHQCTREPYLQKIFKSIKKAYI